MRKFSRRWLIIVVVPLIAFTTSGCLLVNQARSVTRLTRANAEIAEQRAEILRMYKDCLKRMETDRSIDCSEYRVAVEIHTKEP